MTVYLTRKCEFSASHHYFNPAFSEEENRRTFGKCANLNGHGHNYTLEVTVKGEVDATTGFVVDLKELKEIMNREVVDAMDHRYLNHEVAEFKEQIPTTENIAIAIWKRVEGWWGGAGRLRFCLFEMHVLWFFFEGKA